VAAVAIVAGGDALTAVRLGVAMTALQTSIGALNDVVDAPRDAGYKPGKPIPVGLVSPGLARAVVAAGAAMGLALTAPSGLSTIVVAIVGLAIGYGYDLALKGTAGSWVPFAIGIPLLPVFGWLGTTGSLPRSFLVLLPLAVLAGTALAIANARADAERDAAAGVDSVALRLGLERAGVIETVLLGLVVGAGIVTLLLADAPIGAVAGAVGGGVITAAGVVVGRSPDSARLEAAWEIVAVGLAVLAAAWLAGVGLAS
jgi:4-hydroxybenzoate polyprenyltransferase